MAKRSRRSSKLKALPKAAEVVAFTELEEAFFREGELETFEVSEEEKQSFWKRLFTRAA